MTTRASDCSMTKIVLVDGIVEIEDILEAGAAAARHRHPQHLAGLVLGRHELGDASGGAFAHGEARGC